MKVEDRLLMRNRFRFSMAYDLLLGIMTDADPEKWGASGEEMRTITALMEPIALRMERLTEDAEEHEQEA